MLRCFQNDIASFRTSKQPNKNVIPVTRAPLGRRETAGGVCAFPGRAVSDALPLLQKMQEVVVVGVIQDESTLVAAHSRVDDVIAWLKRHSIEAFARVFHWPEREDPMEKLFQYGADFIVAGAYGHTRLREWCLVVLLAIFFTVPLYLHFSHIEKGANRQRHLIFNAMHTIDQSHYRIRDFNLMLFPSMMNLPYPRW